MKTIFPYLLLLNGHHHHLVQMEYINKVTMISMLSKQIVLPNSMKVSTTNFLNLKYQTLELFCLDLSQKTSVIITLLDSSSHHG